MHVEAGVHEPLVAGFGRGGLDRNFGNEPKQEAPLRARHLSICVMRHRFCDAPCALQSCPGLRPMPPIPLSGGLQMQAAEGEGERVGDGEGGAAGCRLQGCELQG